MSSALSIPALADLVQTLPTDALAELGADPRRGVARLVAKEQKRRERIAAESRRLDGMLVHERELWARGLCIAGVDEVGVGPLAGPVVAAVVVLRPGTSIDGIDDSKRLDPATREALAQQIHAEATGCSIGSCSREEIDTLNIYRATLEAMRRAVVALELKPDVLLVDARTIPGVTMMQRPITRGDQQSQSIAAASIVAKVHRDAWMRKATERFPGYGFENHKGYYCPQHLEALADLGPCPLHRRSFSPVARYCGRDELAQLETLRERSRTERPEVGRD